MASVRILFSWIGHNDLLSATATESPEQQSRVLAALEIERRLPLKAQEGPVKTLLDQEGFDEVHLLCDYPKSLRQMYSGWLGHTATIHVVSLADPSDYGQILEAVESVLAKVGRMPGAEFSFLLTSGTPSMAATWILIGKSRYDATFWQTHRGQSHQIGCAI